MFQKSLDTKQIPQDWQKANAKPVHKRDSRNSVSNYRHVSLTSVAGNILEGIVNTHIVGHLTINGLLSDSQHDFRHGRLVETNLTDAYDYITEHLNQTIPVDLVLLNFTKAFVN
ncbi:uncharacterized protein LOC136040722 [Artemia franciscana]|uniref:uncharacterized protein LOC136040722 n=1 Tax=Artemia franciscana TaxID=6661 RepID=UPI0032DB5167